MDTKNSSTCPNCVYCKQREGGADPVFDTPCINGIDGEHCRDTSRDADDTEIPAGKVKCVCGKVWGKCDACKEYYFLRE